MAAPTPDDERFERILRETQGQVRAHIAGMGVPVEDVDDVAQEVYLDFARHPDRVPAEVEVLRWLRGMARNCSFEYFRRRARQAKHLAAIADLLSEPEPEPHVEQEIIHDAQVEALQRCLERLNQPHRALIEGFYRDGRAATELAEEHGRSVGAVHMVLSRLRDSLRRCLLGQLGTAP